MFNDTTTEEINKLMEEAWNAFHVYRKMSLKSRANLMRTIGEEIENCRDILIKTAMLETNLPEVRL